LQTAGGSSSDRQPAPRAGLRITSRKLLRSPATIGLSFLAVAVYVPAMVIACMERVLAGIRSDEVRDFLGMLSLWERAGWIDQEQAAEWKRRISRAVNAPSQRPEVPVEDQPIAV
jgi:hypothetical protein